MPRLFSAPDLRDNPRNDHSQAQTPRATERADHGDLRRSAGVRTPSSASLRIRRLVCCALIMAVVTAAVWAFLLSDITDPVTEPIKPYWDDLAAMINDPMGVDWGAKLVGIATLLMGHLGLLAALDDRFK